MLWVYLCNIIGFVQISKGVAMFNIRRYEPSDYQAVWDLHNLALHHIGAHVGNGEWDDDLHNIDAVYSQNGGDFLVGTEDDVIIAMGALKRNSDTHAEIKRMRVHPKHQKRGLGQFILSALEEAAYLLGYKVLELRTTTIQKAAQVLYERNGYTKTGRSEFDPFVVISYQKVLSEQI